jgi:nucleoside-diphosphate-sugar epimerase
MRALVTGAGGFIGRRLVLSLVAKGYAVRGLYLPEEDAEAAISHGVEVTRGDLTDPTTLDGIANGVTVVFHLAARVTDWGPLEAFRAISVDGTGNLLGVCRGAGIRRFVYFSSFTALGFSRDTSGLDERAECVKTGLPYSDTKREAEILVARLCQDYGIPFTVVRPANVIGPGSIWVKDVLDAYCRGPMPIIGDGTAPAAFVHVQNLVDGVVLAAESEKAVGRTYHFIDDYPVTWAEYLSTVGSWIGKRPAGKIPTRLAWRLGALAELVCAPFGWRPPISRNAAGIIGRRHAVSARLAREDLGWQSRVTYPEAIAEIREWFETTYRQPAGKRQTDYRNYNVYITGGSTGIGLCLAKEYASLGANVAIFARDVSKLDTARSQIEAARRSTRQQVIAVSMDVSDEDDVRVGTADATARVGPPDLLINSAGIVANARFENLSRDVFEAVFRTNVFGMWHVTHALLPALKVRRGQIVNLASAAGLMGLYGYTAYGGSKYALVGISECLRSELRPDGVAVTVVCPPEVTTPMAAAEKATISPESSAVKQMAGVLDPTAVARTIVSGVARKRFMIIPGARVKLLYALHVISFGWLTRTVSDLVIRQFRR